MKIEKGKFYKDAEGNKVGPMRFACGYWDYKGSRGLFNDDGGSEWGYDPDLIEEWLDDAPRTFGQLTDAEKGALLLAHHEGKRIEYFALGGYWRSTANPSWYDFCIYRIAPTRVTGTCEVGPCGEPDFDMWEDV